MTVEFIDANSLPTALDATLPLPGDLKKEGDDHIRNLKLVMKKFYADYLALVASADLRFDALEAFASIADADTLGGNSSGYYTNASNLATGLVPADRLSGTYNINISGTAANATEAAHAAAADTATTATTAGNALKIGGLAAANVVNALQVYENSTASLIEYTEAHTFTTVTKDILTVPITPMAVPRVVVGECSMSCIIPVKDPPILHQPADTVEATAELALFALPSGAELTTIKTVTLQNTGNPGLVIFLASHFTNCPFVAKVPANTTGLRYALRLTTGSGDSVVQYFDGTWKTSRITGLSSFFKVM